MVCVCTYSVLLCGNVGGSWRAVCPCDSLTLVICSRCIASVFIDETTIYLVLLLLSCGSFLTSPCWLACQVWYQMQAIESHCPNSLFQWKHLKFSVKCGVNCRLPGAFLCQYEEVPGFSFIKIFTVGKSYISLFPLSALIVAISFLIPVQHWYFSTELALHSRIRFHLVGNAIHLCDGNCSHLGKDSCHLFSFLLRVYGVCLCVRVYCTHLCVCMWRSMCLSSIAFYFDIYVLKK